jgi:hypothetical protein
MWPDFGNREHGKLQIFPPSPQERRRTSSDIPRLVQGLVRVREGAEAQRWIDTFAVPPTAKNVAKHR